MAKAKYAYNMDYIPDKDVYKAVMFARKMRRDVCPTHVGMNRLGMVLSAFRAVVCPTHVGMNRVGCTVWVLMTMYAPRMWG